MGYLFLAILSSALIAVIMRLSSGKVRANLSMLAANYLVCLLLAAVSGFRLIRHWSAGILMMIFGRPRHGADIGIIGGADGPTAIFVTTSPDVFLYRFALYGLLLILSIIGFIALGKLKRK